MDKRSSRVSGFYRWTAEERRRWVAAWAGLSAAEAATLDCGLALDDADRLTENVIGTFALPLSIAVNFTINGRDYLVPMAVEEPSVVAAVSHAAKLARAGGGFQVGADEPVMIGQVQLLDVPDLDAAEEAIHRAEAEVLALADAAHPTIKKRGGGARGLEVRRLSQTAVGPMLVVHLLVDGRDAMGANAVNTTAEAVAPLLERLTDGRAGLRILSNLADRRLAWARCIIPAQELGSEDYPGTRVVQGIVEASAFAQADPYRAATHNKGILNGVDAVALATGNDWRSIEAGAHAFAAREGHYTALATWEETEQGELAGHLEMPLAVGIVGGTTQAHPTARVALKILGVQSAHELAAVMAAVGLAQNLAALKALATEGIQRGHLALHARQVAVAAGATGAEVERIAAALVAEGQIRETRARELLAHRA
ncbi:MAG: hydroxymethylglutaryl-CoA reductase, degradative [Anaerolineae bacterium]|nr:hydroxymethylglutaryl-CoA reductase, degradative [Anaerolineae bacterium]